MYGSRCQTFYTRWDSSGHQNCERCCYEILIFLVFRNSFQSLNRTSSNSIKITSHIVKIQKNFPYRCINEAYKCASFSSLMYYCSVSRIASSFLSSFRSNQQEILQTIQWNFQFFEIDSRSSDKFCNWEAIQVSSCWFSSIFFSYQANNSSVQIYIEPPPPP